MLIRYVRSIFVCFYIVKYIFLICKTFLLLILNSIAFIHFLFYSSPSSLTGKKSNEIILGGLNSLKSAATTVVKKFDEIKEAISATSTPVKNKEREQKIAYGISHESLDSLTDGSIQDRNETRGSGREL